MFDNTGQSYSFVGSKSQDVVNERYHLKHGAMLWTCSECLWALEVNSEANSIALHEKSKKSATRVSTSVIPG